MCLNPLRAELPPDGGRPVLNSEGNLLLPCGKCDLCISKRAIEWATRARHEMSLHEDNSFLTLTYAPEKLESNFTVKEHFQKFMKRLRKKTRKNIRYMVSYEYGTNYFRPHMHAILFGYNPPNQKHTLNSPSGHKLFTSPEMEDLWDYGFHSIGEANEQTAYYIASYALKGEERTIVHPDTGEEVEIRDQMDCSKNPGIGLKFFAENYDQIIDSDSCMPRYYQKKLDDPPKCIKDNPKYTKFMEEKDAYLQIYQDKVQEKLKQRSDYETYAKCIIQDQKNSLHSTIFRGDSNSIEENSRSDKKDQFQRYLKNKLRDIRDTYVSLNKENVKC